MVSLWFWWYSEEPDGAAVSALRRATAKVKQLVSHWMGDQKYLELLRASEGTLSCWSRLHLQSLAPPNPHWALVVARSPYV
jgi:hypothetical protein